jgi:hypothetical protein
MYKVEIARDWLDDMHRASNLAFASHPGRVALDPVPAPAILPRCHEDPHGLE